jgi:serine/threonine protein phosphatase 1
MSFVIGDIHGEISKLEKLIDNILLVDSDPNLIFIGDYIDKGENPFEVLKYLDVLQHKFSCEFLLGNHEHVWMGSMLKPDHEYLLKYGGRKTMDSFGCSDILETKNKMMSEFEAFFKSLKKYHQSEEYFICHSGISEAYFNTQPDAIPEKEYLFNRYDFIGNNKLYLNRFKIIFGHTAFYSPYVDSYKIGIDTAACFMPSQPLTAFNTRDKYFINSNNSTKAIESFNSMERPNIVRKTN